MIVVFYDTKNNCEVKSNQLVFINYVCDCLFGDQDDPSTSLNELGYHRFQLGDIGWKSKDCPSYKNWDMWTLRSNLVFLRLEEEIEEELKLHPKDKPKKKHVTRNRS